MATKRQAPSDGDISQQPSKRSKPSTYNHQQRPTHHGKKSFKKAHPVNELKSNIRSLRRLLRNDDLPANIRIEKERALQTAERELHKEEKAKTRSDMIGKYHKIRFFDRQKAERRLKKARKEYNEYEEKGDEVEWARLERRVKEYEVDLNYAMYFPLDKDYVSLFPTRRGEQPPKNVDGDAERQGDKGMLEVVRRCMEAGTLTDLREGRLDEEGGRSQKKEMLRSAKKPEQREKPGKKAVSKHVQDEEQEKDSDDETGGGFFE